MPKGAGDGGYGVYGGERLSDAMADSKKKHFVQMFSEHCDRTKIKIVRIQLSSQLNQMGSGAPPRCAMCFQAINENTKQHNCEEEGNIFVN